MLDRNGLRPTRYYVTKDDRVIVSSEVGTVNIDQRNILYKGRLEPGKMLLVDTRQKRIIDDDEIKHQIASEHPYGEWYKDHIVDLDELMEGRDMRFIAQDLREIMARLGFHTISDMVGRYDRLKQKENIANWKAATISLENLLFRPYTDSSVGHHFTKPQDHNIDNTLDMLAEKLGFRRTGALAILWWSVFTVLTALSKGKFSFAAIRFMLTGASFGRTNLFSSSVSIS